MPRLMVNMCVSEQLGVQRHVEHRAEITWVCLCLVVCQHDNVLPLCEQLLDFVEDMQVADQRIFEVDQVADIILQHKSRPHEHLPRHIHKSMRDCDRGWEFWFTCPNW